MSFTSLVTRTNGRAIPYASSVAAGLNKYISDVRAAYLFDEASGTTVADSSGNGINATSVTGGTTAIAGKFGNARTFASTNVNFSTGQIPDPGTWSLSLWYNTPSLPTTSVLYTIARITQTGGQALIGIYNNGGTIQLIVIFRGNGQFYFTVPTPITLNVWNHIVFTYNNGGKGTQASYQHYVNNVACVSASALGVAGGSANDTAFGADGGGASSFLVGSVDTMIFFGHVLTATEVSTLFNAKGHGFDTTNKRLYVSS